MGRGSNSVWGQAANAPPAARVPDVTVRQHSGRNACPRRHCRLGAPDSRSMVPASRSSGGRPRLTLRNARRGDEGTGPCRRGAAPFHLRAENTSGDKKSTLPKKVERARGPLMDTTPRLSLALFISGPSGEPSSRNCIELKPWGLAFWALRLLVPQTGRSARIGAGCVGT
jgi:hypothetical protein